MIGVGGELIITYIRVRDFESKWKREIGGSIILIQELEQQNSMLNLERGDVYKQATL